MHKVGGVQPGKRFNQQNPAFMCYLLKRRESSSGNGNLTQPVFSYFTMQIFCQGPAAHWQRRCCLCVHVHLYYDVLIHKSSAFLHFLPVYILMIPCTSTAYCWSLAKQNQCMVLYKVYHHYGWFTLTMYIVIIALSPQCFTFGTVTN